MKSLIRISNLNNARDRKKVSDILMNTEGIIASEINLNKKEVAIIYDDLSTSIDDIINEIEMLGYMVN